MFTSTTSQKIALVGGVAVVGAAAHLAIVYSGGYGLPGMWMILAAAFAVVAGSIALAQADGRWFWALLAGLVVGEAYAIVTTMDRVVTQRAAAQAPAKAAQALRVKAEARLEEAVKAERAADATASARSAEKDCKSVCERVLKQSKAEAKAEVEAARAEVAALPAPVTVSPLAETLGWSATALELVLAVLGSLAANGFGGVLIAFGAHGNGRKPSAKDSAQADFDPADIAVLKATIANDPTPPGNGPGNGGGNGPNGGNRRKVYTKERATADVIQLITKRSEIPSQETLSARWGVGKGTVSKWLADMERDGLIVRETVGRCKIVRAA